MLIAEADVDFFIDECDRATAASLLPDAGPGWCNEDLLEFEPGRTMIGYLSLLDVHSLDENSASIMLTLLERQQAWLAEMGVRVTALVAGPTPPAADPNSADMVERDPIDAGANLVAASLGLTSGGAQARVDTARAITEMLPRCQVAMVAGLMGYWHARVVA